MWPIATTLVFVVQSSLLLTVHSVHHQNNVPPPQAFPSGIKRLPDIYWNSSNPIFRIDNTDHIIDVNQGRSPNNPMEYDQVNIVCPLYDKRITPNIEETERFIIYHVNREEYDMCRIMTAHPRVIALCNNPYVLTYFTISFRSFSPSPGALEFHAGKDYYFVSTSSKEDLHLRSNGMCRTQNMKLVFKVADGGRATPPPVIDNPQQPSSPPSLHEEESSNSVLDDNDEDVAGAPEDNSEKKRRKRKKKQRQRNNKVIEESEHFSYSSSSVVPPVGSELSYMNDELYRQKEPSLVEKVNNLMKQEASIGGMRPATASEAASVNMLASAALLSSTALFTLSTIKWWHFLYLNTL